MTNLKAALLALCLATLTAFAAPTDRQLVDQYDNAVNRQSYQAALKAAQTIVDRYPESATWQFNLGSMLARTDALDQAIQALQAAADLGYTGVRSFEQSEDLDPLRDDERFIKILEQVQENAAARLNEFIEEAKAHQPKTHIPQSGTDSAPDSPALILALHGTGMRGQQMIDALKDTADQLNMILIAPDALRPTAGGFSWTYRDESEWLVNHTIQNAIEEHNIDPTKVYLIGFSQGANIALMMGQTHPDLFAGIIPICGHYEPQTAQSESDASLPPFYLMTGARDPWKKTYAIAKKDFTKADAPVQVKVLPAQGHQIPSGTAGTNELVKAVRWCQNQN